MMYPMRIFSRFSGKKFMAATFGFKLYTIRKILWALIKIPLLLFPLALIVYFCYAMIALFSKAILGVGMIIKYLGNRDVMLRLMWEGLTTGPDKKSRYTPDIMSRGRFH